MEELDLDMDKYACDLADALAVLYFVARVDANDVEFVLAPLMSDEQPGRQSYETNALGKHSLWMLDFDCCNDIDWEKDGIEKAVHAFSIMTLTIHDLNKATLVTGAIGKNFRERFLRTSSRFVAGSSLSETPSLFIEHLEKVGYRLETDKATLRQRVSGEQDNP